MNKGQFYIKNKIEVWAKLISKNNDVNLDIRLDNNPDYGSITDWQYHNLEFIVNCSEFSNELYHYYFMPIIYKYLQFQKKHDITQIDFLGKHPDFKIVAGFFLEKKIKVNGLKFVKLKIVISTVKRFILYTKTHLIAFGSIVFKGFQSTTLRPYKPKSNGEFALIHSKASFNKIEKLKFKLTYFYDDINFKNSPNNEAISLYKTISFIEYLKLISNTFIRSHRLLRKLRITSKLMLGDYGSLIAINFFSFRIGHFILVEEAYKNIFKRHSGVKFYSGEKESSYGVLANNFSNQYSNFGIAIPHGLSYSYNYPLGLFGDRYYATTKQESNYLNKTYNETKFIYDEKINKTIYQTDIINKKNKQVVFFTEPRRQFVNFLIIKNISEMLNQTLYLKLHPLEKQSDYQGFKNIKFISDFDESIQSNICISRKSTILIEALYNNSKSIAILIDEQDKFDFFNSFPSLSDSSINKCYSYDILIDLIQNKK